MVERRELRHTEYLPKKPFFHLPAYYQLPTLVELISAWQVSLGRTTAPLSPPRPMAPVREASEEVLSQINSGSPAD